MTDICQHCGAEIHLISRGKHYKWVTNTRKPDTWVCPIDPERPVLTHSPIEEKESA